MTNLTNIDQKPFMRFEGDLVYITGKCPLPWCEWVHQHSHARDTLHEYAKDRAAAKKLEAAPKAIGPAPVTNASAPAPASTAPKTIVTHVTSTHSPYIKTPPAKKKYINVYRIRTVSSNMVLDVTVKGAKRKDAVLTARESHSKALRVPLKEVSLSFARYVWQYEVRERTYGRTGTQKGLMGDGWYDENFWYM